MKSKQFFKMTRLVCLMAFGMIFASCSDDPISSHKYRSSPDIIDPDGVEGELLGRIYDNGQPTTRLGLSVLLEPQGNTADRLKGDTNLRFDVDPSSDLDFEWYDPASSDGPVRCGTLTDYNAGKMTARSAEVHGFSESGKEEHCIRPGTYIMTVMQNGQPIPGASFQVE